MSAQAQVNEGIESPFENKIVCAVSFQMPEVADLHSLTIKQLLVSWLGEGGGLFFWSVLK